MKNIFVALGRSVRSLVRPGVFVHLIWPGIASALIWTIVAWYSWAAAVDAVMGTIKGFGWLGNWISSSGWASDIVLLMVKLSMVLAFVPLFYITSSVLVSLVALPKILDRVARRDYADLERHRGGSDAGSIGNTLVGLLWYVLVMVVSLPLWLIPGVALIVPLLATGWLNQRVLGYDALMHHADPDEFVRLRRELRPQMLMLGSGTTLLAYVPVVNVVSSALSGLSFVHFLLEALRRERQKRGGITHDSESGDASRKTHDTGFGS
ncbi:MAG: EI24 domain-containing protein [Betaproteobacteria bacterium]|nr:EI24 domain-containing protein [Betaproteobacteria bacterium]